MDSQSVIYHQYNHCVWLCKSVTSLITSYCPAAVGVISAITVSGCEGHLPYLEKSYDPAAIFIVNSYNTLLHRVSIQNDTGYGLLSVNSFNLSIEDSSFYHNQYPLYRGERCHGGNA